MFRRLILYIFLIISAFAYSQTEKQKQLEAQKAQIQKQIAVFKELLKTEQNKEKSILERLQEQNTKIILTENLVNNTKEQEALLSKEIKVNERNIAQLSKEIDLLKAD